MKKWSGKRDSNPRPLPWQGNALPLSYSRARSTNVSIALTSTKFTGIQSLCQIKMCIFLITFQQVLLRHVIYRVVTCKIARN